MSPSSKSLLAIFAVILADQFTKLLIQQKNYTAVFQNPDLFIPAINLPGFFDVIILIILLGIFAALYFKHLRSPRTTAGFALIVGGAVSNILDRIPDGTATDFINLGISTINLADLAIMMGIGYLILCCKKSIPRQLSD